jgi:hypothetical protein
VATSKVDLSYSGRYLCIDMSHCCFKKRYDGVVPPAEVNGGPWMRWMANRGGYSRQKASVNLRHAVVADGASSSSGSINSRLVRVVQSSALKLPRSPVIF